MLNCSCTVTPQFRYTFFALGMHGLSLLVMHVMSCTRAAKRNICAKIKFLNLGAMAKIVSDEIMEILFKIYEQ